jgi:hypothetical protein
MVIRIARRIRTGEEAERSRVEVAEYPDEIGCGGLEIRKGVGLC